MDEKEQLIPSSTPCSNQPDGLSEPTERQKVIRQWIGLFALNARLTLEERELALTEQLWEMGLADLEMRQLRAAFMACLRAHAIKTLPTVGDIRKHIEKAKGSASEEVAALKWTRVLNYAMSSSPDYPDRNPPHICEQTGRAIRAAGGLDYIRECSDADLQWARKRFIESYVRYDELEQEQYLLPEGEVKELFKDLAKTKALPA